MRSMPWIFFETNDLLFLQKANTWLTKERLWSRGHLNNWGIRKKAFKPSFNPKIQAVLMMPYTARTTQQGAVSK